jgi:hypothetical protein
MGLRDATISEVSTDLQQDIRNDAVDLPNKFEKWVVGKMLQSKLPLGCVARIGLSQDCMAVTWDNLATIESGPHVFLDRIVTSIDTYLQLHLSQPDKHFLVGETVQWASKPIQ